MSCRIADFRQRPSTSQGMADEGVAAMVNGQRGEAVRSQHIAGGAEPLAYRVAREGKRPTAWQERYY